MIFNIFIIIVLFAFFFITSEVLYAQNVPGIVTRKISHVGGGLVAASLPFLVDYRTAIAFGVVFSLFLLWTKKYEVLKSIHHPHNTSVGSILFTPSLTMCAIFFWPIHPLIFQGACMTLALADGLAGLIGSYLGTHSFRITGPKTLEGSGIFFAVAVVVLLSVVYFMGIKLDGAKMGFITSSALALTCVEAALSNGWDNVFIPLLAGVILTLAL